MAKSFLKKVSGKQAMGIVQQSATRSAGTIGAAYVANNLMGKLTFIKPNMRGAVMLALGVAGEVMVNNETVRTFAEGVTSYGALAATGDLILGTTKKAQLGLSGVEDGDYEEMPRRELAGARKDDDYDWSKALSGAKRELDEMREEAAIEGVEDEDNASGSRRGASWSDLLS